MTPAFALRQRADAAFEALYSRHVREVYRYALAVLGNPADAEDVTQTTFMNAYRAYNAGERPLKPAHWLRAIAHNVCRQRFRQAARRPHELSVVDELADPAAVEDSDAPSAADITRALQALPFNQRSALVMRELEGRRQAEIAEALAMSESAVEALLFRARRAMREQLETAITCGEAARAISRQLDRSLSREERGALRAHLRECDDCATFARQARAQRGAVKALGAVPVPASLLSWSGGTGAAGVGAAAGGSALAIGMKVAAGVAAVAFVAGAGEVGVRYLEAKPAKPAAVARAQVEPAGRAGGAAPASLPVTGRAEGRAAHRGPASSHGAGAAPGARLKLHHRGNGAKGDKTTPVRAHGEPAQSHGRAVQAHGRPVKSHGRPVTAPHRPASKPPKPARAHHTPTRAHGRPVKSHGQPAPPPADAAIPDKKPHGKPPKP